MHFQAAGIHRIQFRVQAFAVLNQQQVTADGVDTHAGQVAAAQLLARIRRTGQHNQRCRCILGFSAGGYPVAEHHRFQNHAGLLYLQLPVGWQRLRVHQCRQQAHRRAGVQLHQAQLQWLGQPEVLPARLFQQ